MAFTDEDGIACVNWATPASAGAKSLPGTNVPLNANGATALYTVPPGYVFWPSFAKLKAGANANSTDLSIGANASSYNDFIPVTQLDNLDAANDMVILHPVPSTTPVKCKCYTAGQTIYALVANQAGGATNRLMLFGILEPA